MLTQTIRKGSELSDIEKADISTRMFLAQSGEQKDSVRISLSRQYGITASSVGALVAHETMRRKKSLKGVRGNSQEGEQDIALIDTEQMQGNPTQAIQKSTQARVYAITSLAEITEEIREGILKEFTAIIQDNISNTRYDFYTDIEAISDYNNIDPTILEQLLRNRYIWLSSRLDELKKGKAISEEKMLNKNGGSIEGVPNDVPKGGVDEVTIGGVLSPLEQITPQDNIAGDDTLPEEVFSGEDRKFIQELAQDFDLNNDGNRAIFLQDVFDCFPEATIEDIKKIIPYLPDDQSHVNIKRSGEGMGALVNYNNEIKNKWRGKLKEFIDANTDPEKRKDMKVLCLPGIECLEIPLYLELGFRPENIVGVEAGIVKGKKDPELIALFQANADKYGIQTRIGKLDKILEIEKIAVDVASLDFLGPINLNAISILKAIKSREGRTIVLTNFQAKRENMMQDYMIGIAGLKQQNGKYIIEGKRRTQSLLDPQGLREYSGKSLKDSRDDASVAQIIRGARVLSSISPKQSDIGTKIREIFTTELDARYAKLDSRILGEEGLIRHMIMVISGTFDRVLDNNMGLFRREEREIFKTNLHVLIRNVLFHHRAEDIRHHSMYAYNATGTTMITDCLVLEYGNDNELYGFRQLIQFILNLAAILTEKTISILENGDLSPAHEELSQYHFKFFDKKRMIKQGYRASSDELVLQYLGKTLLSITVGKFFGALQEYITYKNGCNRYAKQREIITLTSSN